MSVLVTGCAGFIGSNLTDELLDLGYQVIGVDNFNDYYDPIAKKRNLAGALKHQNFKLYRADVVDSGIMKSIFTRERPEVVVHLAARAGVRPSLDNPILYSEVNKIGTINLLKFSVDFKVNKFIFGSSSSVYGNSSAIPFVENNLCTDIISPYGASKRAAEIFIETFNKVYGLKAVVLRFFTVYGPRGRPDMAPAIFTKAIIDGKPINQFGDGSSSRDYTFIDDIVNGIVKSIDAKSGFDIINLGNNKPVNLKDFISTIETITKRKAMIKILPKRAGDMDKTWSNIQRASAILRWQPKTSLSQGLEKYTKWLKRN